jgi:cytochrome c oxidase cbb3-type subunit 3/ubiquinol-cytochrome c reductase cytochrome c subunit
VKPRALLVLGLSFAALAAGCARKTNAAASPPLAEKGRGLYVHYCATCHGPNATGYAADNAPSLRTTTFLESATDAFLREGILRGRPGTAMGGYGRAYGGPLGPEDADAIIAFIRLGGPKPVALPAVTGRPPGDAKRGKPTYDGICARCHGTPTQRVSAVHLANLTFLSTASDAFLRHAIENGRPPTSMVPWKGALPPPMIDDVVAYLRSLVPAEGAPAPVVAAPRAPRKGPIVLNPKGRAPDFKLKEDRYVGIDQVKKALDEKRRMIIADARGPSEYESLHIAGAISTPYYEHESLDDLPNDGTWVLAYCACPHHVSGEVVDELRKRGYKHTAVIDEGVFAWQAKKYPVVAAPNAPPPPAPPPMPAPPSPHGAAPIQGFPPAPMKH